MTEYSEVIKQFKRMCKTISAAKCTRGECPMGREFGCENIGQCRKIAFERYAEFEKLVMAWAAEHPEPVYETWGDWFVEQAMLIEGYQHATSDAWMAARFRKIMHTPIPDDIAQKLGIEPKEG